MHDLFPSQLVGLGLALGLGLLVGLERQWADHKLIGLRTFALVGLSGGLAALLGDRWGAWTVAAGLLAVTTMLVARYLRHRHDGAETTVPGDEAEHGATTLLAAVAVYLIGAACVAGYRSEAVVLGGVTTLLLHWKRPLHDLVERIGREEFAAVIRLVLITLVVLPVLPNRTFGPYDVFNPFEAWLLVVIIVTLNLAGYIAFRLFRADSGTLASGVLGGLISSTATTVSFSGMTRRSPELAASATLIILVASAVVYPRVGVELLLVAPGLLVHAAAPMAAFTVVMVAASALVWPTVRGRRVSLPEQRNPARLEVAVTFAGLYVVILFAVAAARTHIGDDAIFAVALVSGLTDVDALTLSVAQMFARDGGAGGISADMAWRAIFLATLANLAFKITVASVLGPAELRRRMLTLGGTTLGAGIAVLLLWP